MSEQYRDQWNAAVGRIGDVRRLTTNIIAEQAQRIAALEGEVERLKQERDELAVEIGKLQRATEHPGLYMAIQQSLGDRTRLKLYTDLAAARARIAELTKSTRCHCASCDPGAWPETNGWRCKLSERIAELEEQSASAAYRAEAQEWMNIAANCQSIADDHLRDYWTMRANEAIGRAEAFEAAARAEKGGLRGAA